jgi:hypothetical protein
MSIEVPQMNPLELLLEFVSRLQESRIQFDLKCVRNAIMVIVVSPGKYYEIEFFSDGHIEVQTYGPANPVQTVMLQEITERVVRDVNG